MDSNSPERAPTRGPTRSVDLDMRLFPQIKTLLSSRRRVEQIFHMAARAICPLAAAMSIRMAQLRTSQHDVIKESGASNIHKRGSDGI